MFGSEILDVAVGLILLFLIVSILCSAIREGLESFLKTRAAYLERGIRELLADRKGDGLAAYVYMHPLVGGLFLTDYRPGRGKDRPSWRWIFAKGGDLPSYIPARNFALALMDIAARGPTLDAPGTAQGTLSPISIDAIRKNTGNIQNASVRRVLMTAVDTAGNDIDKLQETLEHWYDSSMDRVSGWYKRSTQWIIFAIAAVLAASMNIDAIKVSDYLYQNKSARAAVVARAQITVADTGFLNRSYDQVKTDLSALQLPIGWTTDGKPVGSSKLPPWMMPFGWLVTALAATMGAPFWFDMLNKVSVIRSTVKPTEKSPDEGSEDRQPATLTVKHDADAAKVAGNGNGAHLAAEGRVPVLPGDGRVAVLAADDAADACDAPITGVTPDEELPLAEGGVR
jgi:hypothetical protein